MSTSNSAADSKGPRFENRQAPLNSVRPDFFRPSFAIRLPPEMLKTDSYIQDTEFQKLIRRAPEIDLTTAALELARDFCPDLNFSETTEWIRARARDMMTQVARCKSDREILQILSACLGEELGGDDDCYAECESSYINRVVKTGRGLPIATSVVYMGVARHLGIELLGVAAPMHFLTRMDADEGPLFIDSFHHGEILTFSETTDMLVNKTQQSPDIIVRLLEPCNERSIIRRMLHNLKSLFSRQECWTNAWLVQQRLLALSPASYREQRDFALISIRAQRTGLAISLLSDCLQVCPNEDRPVLEQQLAFAKRDAPNWN